MHLSPIPGAAEGRAALEALATAMGVRTQYVDGLGKAVTVSSETLVRVCAALGAPVARPEDAADALAAHRAARATSLVPPALVAWDGMLDPLQVPGHGTVRAELHLEGGGVVPFETPGWLVRAGQPLPFGYHRLTVEVGQRLETCTVISAPTRTWRRRRGGRSWGLGVHLAALRSTRSRTLGDLLDLETLCRWVGRHGGDLVTVLPLLPTFNAPPAEPSPYAPVSRLFWSELILDLGEAHRSTPPSDRLDVTRADAEVRAALASAPAPDPAGLDPELLRYARFRGAQARLGRDWRSWPQGPRDGRITPADVDGDEERFHLVAQTTARHQLAELRRRLEADGSRLGLDLAVGVHPDGYDPWSRQGLFAEGMSVGAPPDPGFPSGQDWGFPPVLPEASRREGHRYLAATIAHQAAVSGLLRVDHIMALTRLYWIPLGSGIHEGTYVGYPAEELFAVLTLESHRNRCEIVGENLGVVPVEITEALPRHGIRGMQLVVFEATAEQPAPPDPSQVALIGTHDTPTLAGWLEGIDIDERVRCGLLEPGDAPEAREAREAAIGRLAKAVGGDRDDLPGLLTRLLSWLGRSPSPLVVPWIADLWLESAQVNLPGTRSSERPNWQLPLSRAVDEALADPEVVTRVEGLRSAREAPPPHR